MSANTSPKDIRAKAYVIHRINYGEADRILNIITPIGKFSAIAKSVRKEKSKLAGNIELFCLIDMNIHNGKNNIGTVTGAKMLKYHNNIVTDLKKLELASLILKKINALPDTFENSDFFDIVDQSFENLNQSKNLDMIESWFWFKFAKANGEDINLYRDTDGDKLNENQKYIWDSNEQSLRKNENGNIGANEIKLMRIMLNSNLKTISNIKKIENILPNILYIAKSVNKI